MTKGESKKGCAGAVDDQGNPSRSLCTNQDGRFPWWQACCSWNWAKKTCVERQSCQDGTAHECLNHTSEHYFINSPGYPRKYEKPIIESNVFPIKQDKNGKYDKSIFPLTSSHYAADPQEPINYKTWEISLPEDHKIGLTMLDCDLDPT